MKKLLITAAAVLATLNMYGQGSGVVSFTSVGATTDKKIWQSADGTTRGADLAAGYVAALYWGTGGTTDDRQLVQIGASAAFLTGASAGTYFGGGRTITGIPANGAVLAFQVRAWNTAAGNTWDLAMNNPAGWVGKGPVFDLKTKDPTNPLETTPNLWSAAGYRGFGVSPVPEPSVIGLGLLGAGALLLLRRRK